MAVTQGAGNLLRQDVEALVNTVNTEGVMGKAAGTMTGPRYIINFPTKRHWRARSQLADIESGLGDLSRVIRELGIASVAIPPLGCGNGGLDWRDVEPLIRRALGSLASEVEVRIFAPAGEPPAAEQPSLEPAPPLTPTAGRGDAGRRGPE